jgi:ABC-type spermidine/putrescine transport system permease subunit I
MTDRRRARPPWWQLTLVVAVGVAAIAFVVMLTAGVLADGAGTGRPADFYRALGRELTDPTNWTVVLVSALAAAVVTAVATLLTRRR